MRTVGSPGTQPLPALTSVQTPPQAAPGGAVNPSKAVAPSEAAAETTASATALKTEATTGNYGKADFDPVAGNVQSTPTKNFYVNGIRTPEDRADQARDLVAEKLGQDVELLYNPTEGLLKDGVEAWRNLSGFDTEISQQVEAKFKAALDKGEKVRIFAHSQGSAITADALRGLEETYAKEGKSPEEIQQLMSQVEVVGFGGFADYKSFPEGVNVKLARNKNDHVPQLATASLAIGDSFREVQETPKDAKKWWQLGKASLKGAGTLVKAVGKNVAQAVDSAVDNRKELTKAFKDGRFMEELKEGDVLEAFSSENVNRKQIEAYFSKVCATVQSDHLAVICDEKGKVIDGYITDYFEQTAQV